MYKPLFFWQKRPLALGVWQLLHVGEEWYDEDQVVMRAGGNRKEVAQKLVDIEKKYQASFGDQIKAELAKHEPDAAGMFDAQ